MFCRPFPEPSGFKSVTAVTDKRGAYLPCCLFASAGYRIDYQQDVTPCAIDVKILLRTGVVCPVATCRSFTPYIDALAV